MKRKFRLYFKNGDVRVENLIDDTFIKDYEIIDVVEATSVEKLVEALEKINKLEKVELEDAWDICEEALKEYRGDK